MNGGVGSGSRVPMIPNNVRKIIQDIREITGKLHSDDEIYSVLRECSMDPNETAQKLLYLDTFHEVKRRRDRKKDGLSSRASEESRLKQGGQGRGGRGASGGYSSNFSDGGGGRTLAIRRENGVNHITERIRAPTTHPDLQKKNNTVSEASRGPSVEPRRAANQSNGKSGHGSASQSRVGSIVSVPKSSSAANGTVNQENVQPQAVAAAASPDQTFASVTSTDQGKSRTSSHQSQTSVSGVYSPSSDPVLEPSISRNHGVNGVISREAGSNGVSSGPNHVIGNKLQEDGDLSASNNEKSGSMNSTGNLNVTQKSNEVNNIQLSEPSQLSSSPSLNGSLRSSSSCSTELPPADVTVTEVPTLESRVQSSAELRHVTFPNHFEVPEALKNGLSFGSFNNTFGRSERSSSGTGCDNNASPAFESSLGNNEAATSCNQSVSLTAEGVHLDYSHPPSYLIKNTPASEGNSITVTDSKIDQPKQEVLVAPEGHPILTVQSAQNYGLNFMSTMLGAHQVQFEGSETQAQETSRFPNSISSSSQAVSPSPTPPLQNSIPVSPQPVSVFRPPYPANFFPYGPYYPPFYLSPVHQFLSHNGFPQQPSAGNMYLPAAAAAAAAGIKFPLPPQFKAGANSGNAAHIGIPSGSFITPPVGYAPSPAVNTGSSAGNEDLSVSQLKENQIYSSGQLSEGSAMWMHAPPGQDISTLQVNSMYNLTPQGQHLTFPPTQAFAGIYQPGQTVASPSTLLQQSQAAAAGPVETAGPPSAPYQQQPQPSQINWNSNF